MSTVFALEFAKAYAAVRSAFPDHKVWEGYFRDKTEWNRLMLWRETRTYRPPFQIQPAGSVLARTAKALNLHYDNTERVGVDACFSLEPDWFPIHVAIEHENARDTFAEEARKLFTIRCPLKVGITYSSVGSLQRLLEEKIEPFRNRVPRKVGGPDSAEYLFLAGVEVAPQELEWYFVSFGSGDTGCTFRPVTGI